MKLLLFLITLGLSTTIISQVPNFLENSPEWRVDRMIDWYYPCVPMHHYVLKTAGDTLIENHVYKKILKEGNAIIMDYGSPDGCDNDYTYSHIVSYIRQDSLRFYEYHQGEDQLMYDFDLQIGDTTEYTTIENSGDWIVTSQDSVLIGGYHSKIFYLSRLFDDFISDSTFVIQGVGSKAGLLDHYHTFFESDAFMLCYQRNGIEYLGLLGFGKVCEFDLGLIENTSESIPDLNIYPNPVHDELNIHYQNRQYEITIRDLVGKLVHEQSSTDQITSIDVTKLKQGMYILTLRSDDDVVSKQIIVE